MGWFSHLHNSIFIHTDKQQYYHGEVVNGTINLAVNTPMHVDAVYLKFKGVQECHFEYQESYKEGDQTKYRTRTARESDRFVHRRYQIYSYKCTLANGSFCFPFSFVIDSNLPGTFECRESTYGGSVYYELEAEVAVPGMLTPNLRHSQELIINQPLNQQMQATDTFKQAKVTFLCCIPKGEVGMAANIDRNAYAPGDQVNLRLQVDNSNSQVNLEAASLKLHRTLTLRAEGRSFSTTQTVCKAKSMPIAAGEQTDRFIQVGIPHRSEPSTDGHLVNNSYSLEVCLSVPWSPNVRINQPVQIYQPARPTFVVVPQMPPNWQPQMMPVVQLNTMSYQNF